MTTEEFARIIRVIAAGPWPYASTSAVRDVIIRVCNTVIPPEPPKIITAAEAARTLRAQRQKTA